MRLVHCVTELKTWSARPLFFNILALFVRAGERSRVAPSHPPCLTEENYFKKLFEKSRFVLLLYNKQHFFAPSWYEESFRNLEISSKRLFTSLYSSENVIFSSVSMATHERLKLGLSCVAGLFIVDVYPFWTLSIFVAVTWHQQQHASVYPTHAVKA